jgi:hypothetical protein
MPHHPPKGALVIAADRRSLNAALANFEPNDLSVMLADALVQRFGLNRAEMILERAIKEMLK